MATAAEIPDWHYPFEEKVLAQRVATPVEADPRIDGPGRRIRASEAFSRGWVNLAHEWLCHGSIGDHVNRLSALDILEEFERQGEEIRRLRGES
jgi:hypothetical protein